MTLNEHVAAGPQWIFYWVNWIVIINAAAILFLVRWSDGMLRFGHIEAVVILVAMAAVGVFMEVLFSRFGYTRILGLSHIVIWTPVTVYLWMRLKHHPRKTPFGIYMRVLIATFVVTLAFDYTDFIRYLAGDTAMS